MSLPGSGFESNGQGYCRKCGKTRIEFGFMPGKCECTKSTFHVTAPSEQASRAKRKAEKNAVV
jgi:hypothetical protein